MVNILSYLTASSSNFPVGSSLTFPTLINVLSCHDLWVLVHSFIFNAIIGLKYTSSKMDESLLGTETAIFLESCIFSKSSLGRRLFLLFMFSCSFKLRLREPDNPGFRLLSLGNVGVELVISARTTWFDKSSALLREFIRSPLTSSSEASAESKAPEDSLCLFSWFAYLLTDKVRCPGDVWRLVEWISAPAFTNPRRFGPYSRRSPSLVFQSSRACLCNQYWYLLALRHQSAG